MRHSRNHLLPLQPRRGLQGEQRHHGQPGRVQIRLYPPAADGGVPPAAAARGPEFRPARIPRQQHHRQRVFSGPRENPVPHGGRAAPGDGRAYFVRQPFRRGGRPVPARAETRRHPAHRARGRKDIPRNPGPGGDGRRRALYGDGALHAGSLRVPGGDGHPRKAHL